MAVNKEDSTISKNLAKQLLKGKGVYLTQEGKRRLHEILKENK